MQGSGDLVGNKATSSNDAVSQRELMVGRSVWRQIRTGVFVAAAAGALASCGSAPETPQAKFSPDKYGVKGSPRIVSSGQPVPKGGGRYVVGKDYKIAGKWYYPKHDPNYVNTGLASWYGPTFHGRKTANGEVFDRNGLTAAHTTMPLPSYARVTNTSNGRSMIVRVNDRGPFHGNRIIDLSERVATLLGTKDQGVGKVKVEYVGRAPLHGQDETYLMASLQGPGAVQPGTSRPGTLIALDAPRLIVGPTSAPPPRPYLAAGVAPITVSFDPAIAFEASSKTVRIASSNRFEAPAAAFARPTGLSVPAPMPAPALVPGSAVSSFAANNRITDAHQALASSAEFGLSLRALATRATELR